MKLLLGGVANLEISYPRCGMSSAVWIRCGSRLGSVAANLLSTAAPNFAESKPP
jgi:hypothetical protein